MVLRCFLLVIFASLSHFSQSKNDITGKLIEKYKNLPKDKINERITLLNDIAWEYAYINPDSALHFGNLAKMYAENTSYNVKPRIKANTYGTLGVIYDITGKKELALTNYLNSLDISVRQSDHNGIAIAANNIGALFHSLNDHKKALNYFEISYENEMLIKDTLSAIGSMINIAVCFKNLGEVFNAKKVLFRSLELCNIYDDTLCYGQIYNNLGAAYLEEDQRDSAFFYFIKGLQFNDYSDNYYNMAIAHENLAKISLMNKNIKKSKENIVKALQKAKDGDFYTLLVNSYETAFEVYLYDRKIDSAYYYKSLLEEIKDSVQNKEQKKIIDELETKYKINEIEKKVLKKDLEIAESRNTNLIYLITIVVSGVILLIVILFALMKINSNKKLKENNILIENTLKEKEILMREIHHRVKNNIQAIKSILNIQKRKSQQPEVIESLNLTLNRVNTMSLIHKKLYNQKELSNISSEVYFKELIQEATKIYDFKEHQLVLSFDIDDVTIDLDDLFNLGLIINELVTNACKYGISEDGILRLTYRLNYVDNNISIVLNDEGFRSEENKKSFGSTLIKALIQKMNGKIHYFSDFGWKVEILIPYEKD